MDVKSDIHPTDSFLQTHHHTHQTMISFWVDRASSIHRGGVLVDVKSDIHPTDSFLQTHHVIHQAMIGFFVGWIALYRSTGAAFGWM